MKSCTKREHDYLENCLENVTFVASVKYLKQIFQMKKQCSN